ADLSTSITTYISTTYVGATIVSAKKEADGSYEVHISTADGLKLELKFDAAGAFVSLSSNTNNHFPSNLSPVAISNLVTTIKNYISTNYAGAVIKEAHLESNGIYEIVITTSAGVQLKLNFSATGAFLGIKN
ncbi:MAG: hypothetical protein RLZZ44_1295, partial [Bacteroidota bacterium]